MTDVSALPASAALTDAPRAEGSGIWFPVTLVALYWIAREVGARLDAPVFIRFVVPAAAGALMMLLVLVWWMFYKGVSVGGRFLTLGAVVLAAFVATKLAHKDFTAFPLILTGMPYVITVWVVWLFFATRFSPQVRLAGTIGVVALAWVPLLLTRMDGLTGGVSADLHWRWTPTGEERFMAERAKRSAPKPQAATTADAGVLIKEQPGDWPAFRGPNRDGVVRGTHISTDWSTPPKQVWRQRTGAGWSSMSIVDGRLYTQEQRGDMEVVVCLDAATGNELWVHEDKLRYFDGQSGAGPRGTPTFVDGYVITLGAKGVLNCLNAATGAVKWARDVVADSSAHVPAWGVSSSPLIVNDLAIVYSGDKSDKNLLAYRVANGEDAWKTASGDLTYVSPQAAQIQGVTQVLHFSNRGLISVEPETGKQLWKLDVPAQGGVWRAVQPHVLGDSVLVSSDEMGTRMFDVALNNGTWTTKERPYSPLKLKAYFNDYAIHNGHAYGFDNGIFACIDLQTGQRKWKGGHYGAGQMLLLADPSLIIVLGERGDVVLLKATPEKHEELGTFQAIEGKTWNHPVLAHGKLYVRNGEEMACYEVGK